jgi:hypothetical protein
MNGNKNKKSKISFIFNQLNSCKGADDNVNFFETIKRGENRIHSIKKDLENIIASPRINVNEDTETKFSKRLSKNSNSLISLSEIKNAKRGSYLIRKDIDAKIDLNLILSKTRNSNVSNTNSSNFKTHFKNFRLCKPTMINKFDRSKEVARKKVNLEIGIENSSRKQTKNNAPTSQTTFPYINTSHISTLNTEGIIEKNSIKSVKTTKFRRTNISENSNFILKDLETIITDCSERQHTIKIYVAEEKKKSMELNKKIESKIPEELNKIFNVKEAIGGFGSLKEKLRKGFYTINPDEQIGNRSQRSYIYKTFDRDNVYRKNEELDLLKDEESYKARDVWMLKYGLSNITSVKKKTVYDENKEKIKKLTDEIEKSKVKVKIMLKKK